MCVCVRSRVFVWDWRVRLPPLWGLPFSKGKWFSTHYPATVGQILMTFLADPHEISIPMKGWKSHPSSTSARACLQNSYCAHSRWTKCGSFFLSGIFLICWETIATLRDPPAMLGEHLRQKQSPRPSLKPKNFAKNVTGVATKWPRILSNFVKWPIQPLSKIFWTQKKIAKIFFFEKARHLAPA